MFDCEVPLAVPLAADEVELDTDIPFGAVVAVALLVVVMAVALPVVAEVELDVDILVGAAAAVLFFVVLTAVALVATEVDLDADFPVDVAAAVALLVVLTAVALPPALTVRSSVADESRFKNTVA
jgi:hypothetical protein